MIDVDQVSWRYPHSEARSLADITLGIAAGELVVLCGASGSGKSTALRLMNGLVPQFHEEGRLTGQIRVDGLVTTEAELDEIGLRTGTVLQHPRRQFFADTAAEELAFAMENVGVEPERIRTRVGASLEELAAHVPVGQRLRHLSGGQQQQVAIAAAAAHRPAVLLLDEPSSNLCADAVERLRMTLARLKDQGITIVIAEHRLRYLQDLLDRVVVMREGRVDRVWTAAQLDHVADEELAREGLRGEVATLALPPVPAAGASVRAPDPTAEAPPAGLEVTGVSCRLGGRTVLDIEHATCARGAVTAVRGPNGVGKSTLARIVTGLQRSPGTVRLNGRVLSCRARQRASAIVMQDVQRQLFTDSVAAEIDLASGGSCADGGAALAALGLDHMAQRHPLSLSGGEQQRLVIAAVRGMSREVVVFDEPSSGVDRRHLQSISNQIRQLADDGAVVLLISHDEDLLALAADAELMLRPAA